MALLVILIFVACFGAALSAEQTLGRLLERQYTIARDEWERDGCPTWWTWRPADYEYDPYSSTANLLRLRWLIATPDWMKKDEVALAIRTLYRLYVVLFFAGGAAIFWLNTHQGAGGS